MSGGDDLRPRPVATLPGWLEALAAHRGDQPAVLDDRGGLTYGELVSAVRRTAGALLERGLAPGDRIATAMTPSVPHLVAILGALRAGMVATPLNTRLSAVEARAFLTGYGARLIVADEPHAALAEQLDVEHLVLADADAAAPIAVRTAPLSGVDRPLPAVREDQLGLVFPTGGTTGTPKGACYDHGGIWAWLNSVQRADPTVPGEVDLFFSPFFHVTLGVNLMARLLGGGTVRIQPKFDPGEALRAIREGATRITGAPTMFAAIRGHAEFATTDRSGVRTVTFGSSAAAERFVRELLEDYPQARIRTAYGSTETGPVTAVEHEDLLAGRVLGVGRPLPGVRITVVDGDGRPVPDGTVGDLVIDSPWRTRGYVGNPEETARTFRADGVHIGDLGRFEDGWLHIVGRSKEMIVSGGENVFPAEVEQVLSGHPDVAQVLAYGVPDEFWGERVEITVVPQPGAAPELDALRAFGRSALAGYKLPRGMRTVDALPVTANNKPDRRRAREDALRAAEDQSTQREESAP